MKTTRLLSAVLIGATGFLAACTDGLLEANINRNAPTDVGPEFLLPQAIRAVMQQTFGAGQMLSHTAIWPQHAVQIQYPEEEQGNVRADGIRGYWNGYYTGPLKDIQVVIEKGEASNRADVEAIGRIWKAYTFHLVTDLWGDVPYSQALQGEADITTPEYDTQQSIYNSMLQELTQAASMLDAGGSGLGRGDILFQNDLGRWKRFANSLRMRLAMRMVNADASAAQAAFVAAYQAGGFQSNSDHAMFNWPGAPYQNPIFQNWQGRDDHGVSATMIEALKSLADPRLQLYAEPAQEDGEYRGLQNNVANPPLSLAWYSRIGNFWRANGAATPTPLMTYSEVLFLTAEAAQRGWIAGDPAALYAQAIRANMNQFDAWSPANAPTDAEIDAYLANPAVVYDAARGLEQIHTQMWISLFMGGNEAWSHWRRTNTPNLVAGPDLGIARIPVRFSYADSEQSLNAASLNAAVQRQGGGIDLITPVWWDR